ncbi:DNA-3-methyladenine glycosylase family protein [Flavobacterium phycosphaerae]|uniref:DNA-3-methyladenine glycosylase family protein n=1 Tax=Flavobacterium phycosphaerae TaxID=2697515 RepID=UPI0013894E0D|nr:DNA-3-methyladenine glycosylase 2 family protein [Flavobacterium phycosphaerae]
MQDAVVFLAEKDKILQFIVANFGHPVIQKREEGFAALCHIILEQQVSIASAKACYAKLQNYYGEIHPEKIYKATDEELRGFGVSRQKSIYLKHLAEKVLNNEIVFESFASKSQQEIREELLQLKGVGNWTVEVYLMFCLQAPDIIPLGDIAIRNTIKELYDIHTLEEMEQLADNWKPHRTLASYILWHYYLKRRNKI